MDARQMIKEDKETRIKIADKLFALEAGKFKQKMLDQFWNDQFLYVEARYKFNGKKVLVNGWDLYEEFYYENKLGIITDANYSDSENRENIYFSVYVEELNEHVQINDCIMEIIED